MESLPSTSLSFSSVIKGHHVYKTIWTPYLGKELVLAAEETNLFDRHAVAVLKYAHVVTPACIANTWILTGVPHTRVNHAQASI